MSLGQIQLWVVGLMKSLFGLTPGGGQPSYGSALLPTIDDGAALGSTSKEWSDLFLASGAVINWANGNVTWTHSAATITASEAFNFAFGTSTGTQIGTATAQKLAFHGSTAVIQRAGAAQAAVATDAATSTLPFGYTEAQANAIVALVNELRAALVQKGLIKGAA